MSDVDKYIVSKLSSLIVFDDSNFEIVDHMPNIGNAVFVDYKILSFLFYLIRNMDIFLLIFQPSEFLTIYTIVIIRLLSYFRPRFSVLSLILDILENAHRYLALHKGFAKAFDFLLRPDLKELPVGKYEIDAESVYAIVSKDAGRRKEDALLETHEKYIDIQLVLTGVDEMGWKPRSLCKKPAGKYDQKNDEQIFTDEPDAWTSTKSGAFVIFFPEDAHMPLISSGQIHKVVVKIAVK